MTNRPTRQTPAGRAYLDLQNRARRVGGSTQQLLTLYVVERWLARLARSPYAEQFVLKGGMLLAAFDARRPTADVDALARDIANDHNVVLDRVVEIASLSDDDGGVAFLTDTATARTIRDDAHYAGVRIAMDARIATATVKFRLDVNFGDPVTPAARRFDLPSIRPGVAPVPVLGYPIETVLAEKLVTAITLGAANTRVRDYADIYTLTGQHDLAHAVMYDALRATAEFRKVELVPLSTVIDDLLELRQATYLAYRRSLGSAGESLPADFAIVGNAVTDFADPLIRSATPAASWSAQDRRWTTDR